MRLTMGQITPKLPMVTNRDPIIYKLEIELQSDIENHIEQFKEYIKHFKLKAKTHEIRL